MRSVVAVSAVLITTTLVGIGLGHLAARFLPARWFGADLFEVTSGIPNVVDSVCLGGPGIVDLMADTTNREASIELPA